MTSVSTVLLFAFIALLAFKGLFGDMLRPSPGIAPYGYPQDRQNAPGNAFGILAGLLIAATCFWLLWQIPMSRTSATAPKPNTDTPHTPQRLDQLDTSKKKVREEIQDNQNSAIQAYENDDGNQRYRINQPPSKAKPAGIKMELTEPTEATFNRLPSSGDIAATRLPRERIPIVWLRLFDTRQEAELLCDHFRQRDIQIIPVSHGYLACILVPNAAEGKAELADWKRHRSDWINLKLEPKLEDLNKFL